MCDSYCTNHGCNRGPSCPAGGACHAMPGCKDTACPGHPGRVRTTGMGKIGRKEHGREPLRGAPWRRCLKDLAGATLLVILAMLLSAVAVTACAVTHEVCGTTPDGSGFCIIATKN